MRPDHVGQVEQSLPGAEVALEPDDGDVRQRRGQVEQVRAVRTAERVDRLGVVADDGQPAPVRPQRAHDVDLGLVDVLVLVDQHVVPAAGDVRAEDRVGEQAPPGEQQVVEVEQPALALAGDVAAQQVP